MKLTVTIAALVAYTYASPTPADAALTGATELQLTADNQAIQAGPPRTSVTPEVYNAIIKYATFTSASRQQPCNRPPFGSTVLKEFSISSTATQASLYKSNSTKELILSFPGTDSLDDIKTDLTFRLQPFPDLFPGCSDCNLHTGFARAFRSIVPDVTQALKDAIQANPDYNVTITGYSLGGALAKFAFVYYKNQASIKDKLVAGYSYGEPRNSAGAFANYADAIAGITATDPGTFFRVTHDNDIVPLILPPAIVYRHSGTEYFAQDQPSTGKPSAVSTYRCYGQEPLDCNNVQLLIPDKQAHIHYPGIHDVQACS